MRTPRPRAAATQGGNVIVAPFDVMDLGRMCVVKDPTGAVLSLWQGRKQKGVGVSGVEYSASWADLNTPDQEKAAAFYSALFGWRMVTGKSMEPAKAGDYFHIVNGTDFIGGVPPPHFSDPNTPPSWLIYFEVPDCRRSTAHAMTLGARAFVDTMKAGEEGVISVLADPQGATFALHQS